VRFSSTEIAPATGCFPPPLQSFRKTKDEPACAGSKHLQMFALSLVHERGELFELQRRDVLG